MKIISKTKVYMTCLLLGRTVGCTQDFKDLNTYPGGVTDEQANADYALVS